MKTYGNIFTFREANDTASCISLHVAPAFSGNEPHIVQPPQERNDVSCVCSVTEEKHFRSRWRFVAHATLKLCISVSAGIGECVRKLRRFFPRITPMLLVPRSGRNLCLRL